MRGVAALTVLAACGRIGFDVSGDATTLDAACSLGPWSTPILLANVNSASDDFAPSLSSDSLTLVFASDRPGGSGGLDLYMATRTSPTAAFDPPQALTQLNTAGPEQAPSFSFDGLTLYYASSSALQRTTRTSQTSPFSNPTPVAELAGVTLLALEITAAGDELFFTRSNMIERATYANGVFTRTGPVTELTGGSTCCPTFTHDGLTVYVASDRGGSLDIYSASRPAVGAPFGILTPETIFSSPTRDDDPDLSDDERTFLVASDRGTSIDLYVSTRACE